MDYYAVLCRLMRVLVVVGIVFGQGGLCAKKLRLHWLNNGGSIVSTYSDKINITIASTSLGMSITCPKEDGYIYRPGTVHQFNNLYIPAQGVILISLEQINTLTPNEGVSINHFINSSQIGFYTASLTIQKLREKASITLSYLGAGVTVDIGGYTLNADYYMLFELTNQDITKYQIPSQCTGTGQPEFQGFLGMGWVWIVGLVVVGFM